MPIKRLSRGQKEDIDNFYYYAHDGPDDEDEVKEWTNDLNHIFAEIYGYTGSKIRRMAPKYEKLKQKPKRKLSAWNKFVKANSNKKIYQYANGKLKLKKMGIAYRKKRR